MSAARDSLFPDVLRDCRDAAALHIAGCKSEAQFDLIPYYEGRRDAFQEILTHFEEHGTGYTENVELEPDGTPSEALCECGHHAKNHVMFSQMQRCEATVYTDAPLGGGSAFPCPCRQFEGAAA